MRPHAVRIGRTILLAGAACIVQARPAAADPADWAIELGGRTSLLAPLWYGGSFAIGMAAGLAGDRASLGFLDETEQQVAEHLDGHLRRLPPADTRSRRIIERMRTDELRHGHKARALGGMPLPGPVKGAMRAMARVMTTVSYRV